MGAWMVVQLGTGHKEVEVLHPGSFSTFGC